MVTIGSEAKKVMGANGLSLLKVGSDTWALAENWSNDGGYKEIIEHPPGTNTPVIGVGGYLGEFESDVIYSTDFPTTLMTLTNGDLKLHTVVFTETDSAGTTKTHTMLNVRIFRETHLVRKDSMVRERVRGVYGAPEVVT